MLLVAEVWAGIAAHSLALLSDAGHVLTDISGLVLAMVALRWASRPATAKATFGYLRAEVLAAMANGILLTGVVVFIVLRAVDRLRHPVDSIDTTTVLVVAVVGLGINLLSARLLHQHAKHNINARGAYLDLVGDALSSVGVIVSTLIVRATGDVVWDTVVAFIVAGIIALGAANLLRSTFAILLERVPPGVDLDVVRKAMRDVDGVAEVTDLHVWTHTPGSHSLTAHVAIKPESAAAFQSILKEVEHVLAERFALEHCTIQIELATPI